MVEIKNYLLAIFPQTQIFALIADTIVVIGFFVFVWLVTFAPIRALKKEMRK